MSKEKTKGLEETPEETQETSEETSEQSIGEQTVPLATAEESSEEDESSEEQSSEEESGEEDESEGSNDLDSFLDEESEEEEEGEDETAKKGRYQKKIDKLIAENRDLKEQLASKDKDKDTTKDDKEKKPKYSRNQLRDAVEKGIQEQDADLIMDVIEYQVEGVAERLRQEYRDEQDRIIKVNKANAEEWGQTVKDYAYLANTKTKELYDGAHGELNLKSNQSLLYRLAVTLYNDPSNASKYRKPGGQRLAVADALARILARRKSTPAVDKEKKRLQKKIAKMKKKSSLTSDSTPGKEDKGPSKPMTDRQRLDSYLDERKSAKAKASEPPEEEES